MKLFQLTIASVTDTLFSGDVQSATLPGVDGELTVLANHAALVTTLSNGEIKMVAADGVKKNFPVEGGILDVGGNTATVLV